MVALLAQEGLSRVFTFSLTAPLQGTFVRKVAANNLSWPALRTGPINLYRHVQSFFFPAKVPLTIRPLGRTRYARWGDISYFRNTGRNVQTV